MKLHLLIIQNQTKLNHFYKIKNWSINNTIVDWRFHPHQRRGQD